MTTIESGAFGNAYDPMIFNGGWHDVINPSSFIAMNGSAKEKERVSSAIREGVLKEMVGVREVNGTLLPTMRETSSAGGLITIARPQIFIPPTENILLR